MALELTFNPMVADLGTMDPDELGKDWHVSMVRRAVRMHAARTHLSAVCDLFHDADTTTTHKHTSTTTLSYIQDRTDEQRETPVLRPSLRSSLSLRRRGSVDTKTFHSTAPRPERFEATSTGFEHSR